jgi:hypothetical protein
MKISEKQYVLEIGRALLKGYFLGVREERKRRLNRRQRGILLGEKACICPAVKRS